MSTQQFAQLLISGVTSGAIYASIALGLNLVFAVSKSLNLAQGEFATVAVLLSASGLGLGWGLVPSFAVAIAVTCLLALLVEWSTFHVARERDVLTRLLVSLAGVMALHGAFLLVWGKSSVSPAAIPGPAIDLLGARISAQAIWLIAVVVVLGIGVPLWLGRSTRGLSLRASADNPLGARLYGIRVQNVRRFAFVGAASVAAIGGLLAAPLLLVRYDTGLFLTINGFIAAVIGGLGRPAGALVGGLALGLVQAFGAAVLPGQYKNIAIFLVLFLIVVLLPRLQERRAVAA